MLRDMRANCLVIQIVWLMGLLIHLNIEIVPLFG